VCVLQFGLDHNSFTDIKISVPGEREPRSRGVCRTSS